MLCSLSLPFSLKPPPVSKLATSGTSKNGVNGGGGDIFIPWGTYNVTLNRFTGEWTFADALGTKGFASSNFKVYPNPTTNNWNFVSNNNGQIDSVRIVDVLGKVVLTNKERINAMIIHQGLKQSDRLMQLNSIAISQIKILLQSNRLKNLS